jgi:hypothetical protein
MNDIRGGRVTSYMIDIRYSAVAEFRGGQIPGSSKLGQRPKGARWEIITAAIVLHSNGESTTLLPQPFQSIFGPTQERDKWRVPL